MFLYFLRKIIIYQQNAGEQGDKKFAL